MPISDSLRPRPPRAPSPAAPNEPAASNAPVPARETPPATTIYAPDGMEVDSPSPRPAVSLSRAEVIAKAKTADVPQRVQQGPTCGLYALGMVMDYWHAKDSSCAAPLVSDADLTGRDQHYNHPPTTDERVLDYAKEAGFTTAGEMFTARDLAKTAAHFGYAASTHEDATLDDVYALLDAGRPAIVAFDVDRSGNPGDSGGKRAHYAVIEGYFDEDGERFLIAKHGWGREDDHVWKAEDFDRSWKALEHTTYYGTPGDGEMPGGAHLKEPTLLDLPDLGGGKAGIRESLATKIVEVVPPGEQPLGGTLIAP